MAALLIGASLALAVWSFVLVVLDRRLDNPLFYAVATLEVALAVQLVAGFVALTTTERTVDAASFSGYLVVIVLILPLAVLWSVAEKSRWGMAVLCVGCLVVAVMVWRLDQVWGAGA